MPLAPCPGIGTGIVLKTKDSRTPGFVSHDPKDQLPVGLLSSSPLPTPAHSSPPFLPVLAVHPATTLTSEHVILILIYFSLIFSILPSVSLAPASL